MTRRFPRVLAACAVSGAMTIFLGGASAGALIDADQITGPVTGATSGEDSGVSGFGAPDTGTLGLPGLDALDDSLSVEGSFETVGCDTNATDERASGGAASGSLPNQNAQGVGVESRCVGEADNAFLGDDNDNDITNTQDNDVCVVGDNEVLPDGVEDEGDGGPDTVNCVQAPATVNTDVEVTEEQVVVERDPCDIRGAAEAILPQIC